MTITIDDLIVFCERTIDLMAAAVSRLGDDLVNVRPDLAGASSPYQLVTHALAASEWWTGHIVCGHPSSRVRDDEFTVAGSVDDLIAATARSKARLRELAPEMATATGLRFEPRTQIPLDADWTVGAALLHAYEELAQHLGHLDLTVDLLLADQR